MSFSDRRDAGRRLAAALAPYASEHPIVLALPRGGVPVADEVARALRAPLDVWIVRKVGAPWQPELGVGAVAEGGDVFISRQILAAVGMSYEELSSAVAAKHREVEERVARFRRGRPAPDLHGRTVIVVDDGIATGGTAHAALRSIRAAGARKIILAVPIAAASTIETMAGEADHIVALETPRDLVAIGWWYDDFRQVSDEEVAELLAASELRHTESASP